MFSNKDELGWDSEVEDSYNGKERLYNFNISGKRYSSSTDGILMDVKAAGLYTTGTRIFKVFEEVPLALLYAMFALAARLAPTNGYPMQPSSYLQVAEDELRSEGPFRSDSACSDFISPKHLN